MADNLISDELRNLLEKKEFVYIATCQDDRPNVAPKFLIKVDKDSLFLADFLNGRTCANLKKNSNVAVSILNIDTLIGYQFLGKAHELKDGEEYEPLIKRLQDREMKFCVERIVAGVSRNNKSENFEVSFPEHFAIFRVDIEEVVIIGPEAKLVRKHRVPVVQSKVTPV